MGLFSTELNRLMKQITLYNIRKTVGVLPRVEGLVQSLRIVLTVLKYQCKNNVVSSKIC